MRTAISMRDLQKLSAGAIQALPHAVPIKNGTSTVAVLLPIHSASREYLSKVLDDIEATTARRTREQDGAIDRFLAERGAE